MEGARRAHTGRCETDEQRTSPGWIGRIGCPDLAGGALEAFLGRGELARRWQGADPLPCCDPKLRSPLPARAAIPPSGSSKRTISEKM